MLIILTVILGALLILDTIQTLNIKKHPALHETNLILGRHPSDRKIIVYFTVCLVLLPLVGVMLAKWINLYLGVAWLVGWIILEAYIVFRNRNLGL